MSAGAFSNVNYEVRAAQVGPPIVSQIVTSIKTQPETVGLVVNGVNNIASPGALTSGYPTATVSASSRKKGIVRARGVRVRFSGAAPGGLPQGYKAGTSIFLPWFVAGTWSAISKNMTGTYLTLAVEVLGVRAGTVS